MDMYNYYMTLGIFPVQWKTARLMLIPKTPTTYRPICLLNVYGKVFEKIIAKRLTSESSSNVSSNQFGFRRGKSTIDAVKQVKSIADRERGRNLVVLVALDVKNAFNSAPWKSIVGALETKGVPPYLLNLIKSYLSERTIIIGRHTMNMTAGVPQGSVLGPYLWNVFYDELLKIKPPNTEYVCYADDLALIVKGKTELELVATANWAIRSVCRRMEDLGLQIAPHKTEAVMLVCSRATRNIRLQISGETVRTSDSLKYLGVLIGRNMTFGEHIRYAAAKATRVTMALATIMPVKRGPGSYARKLIAETAFSAMLYAVPAWSSILRFQKYVDILRKASRNILLRVCRGYCTISTQAAEVIAGIPPIHLRAKMATEMHEGVPKLVAKRRCLDAWAHEWQATNVNTARWTKRLIPDLIPWVTRKHGEVSHEMCQFLSGHGQFRAMLFKANLVNTAECYFCRNPDTAEHTFFECKRFQFERAALEKVVGGFTTDSVVLRMLASHLAWQKVEHFARAVLDSKEMVSV